MQNIPPAFFHDDDADEYEDVDKLFSKLEPFEPPVDMVMRIMNVVAQLPPPQQIEQSADIFSGFGGLIIRHDDKEPS
jgi:hypothetical protein